MEAPRVVRAEVIAIGDELTTGARLDTNSRWISAELATLGIPVEFHTTVCDTLAAGIEAFRSASRRAEIVIATGGRGGRAARGVGRRARGGRSPLLEARGADAAE
jgi:nicotinamide-nucleotide amidase